MCVQDALKKKSFPFAAGQMSWTSVAARGLSCRQPRPTALMQLLQSRIRYRDVYLYIYVYIYICIYIYISVAGNNYANRCNAKRGESQRWLLRRVIGGGGQAAGAGACLTKATPFAVSHFFLAMARTIFYGQACQICKMRQRQV